MGKSCAEVILPLAEHDWSNFGFKKDLDLETIYLFIEFLFVFWNEILGSDLNLKNLIPFIYDADVTYTSATHTRRSA